MKYSQSAENEYTEASLEDILSEFSDREKKSPARSAADIISDVLPSKSELRKPIEILTQGKRDIPPVGTQSYTSVPSEYEIRQYVAQYASTGYSFRDKAEAEEVEIDERFNIGGERKAAHLSYAGNDVDISADEDYQPAEQPSYIPVIGEDTGEDGQEDTPKKKKLFSLRKRPVAPAEPVSEEDIRESREFSTSIRDHGASPAEYAPDEDYEDLKPDEPVSAAKEQFFPTSFKEYLASGVVSMLFRFRKGRTSSHTVYMDDEDLGREQSPKNASKYYGRMMNSMALRLKIAGVLMLILLYLGLGLPVVGMMKDYRVIALFSLALELGIMLCCNDTFTGAVMNAARGRLGIDTMAALSCIVTAFDAVLAVSAGVSDAHLPLCCVSALSILGVSYASYLNCRALRKAIRVPAIAKFIYSVIAVEQGEDITTIKTNRSCAGFVRRSEEMPPDEELFYKVSPFILIFALLLSLIVAAVKGEFYYIVYIFSAVFAPAVPAAGLVCFALPYYIGTMRIFPSGAAIAGWSGICDIGRSNNIILTDRDIFPEGTVEITDTMIAAVKKPEQIIAYAGSMVTAAGVGCANCFAELMSQNNIATKRIEDFKILPGGGMRGVIDSQIVLCGSDEFMHLMNVKVSARYSQGTNVFLAVDGVLYGIFKMKYTPDEKVRKSLVRLVRSSRHPVFALRDFNVTPAMIHEIFDLPTDGYDFPDYIERFGDALTDPDRESKISAVVCRDGLGPYTNMNDTGRAMYLAVRTNIVITLALALLGMFVIFVKFLSVGTVSCTFIMLYMLLSALPVFLVSLFMK